MIIIWIHNKIIRFINNKIIRCTNNQIISLIIIFNLIKPILCNLITHNNNNNNKDNIDKINKFYKLDIAKFTKNY